MRPRRARFRLYGPLNKAAGGTVTITASGQVALVEVRPLRRRKVYTMTLQDVAEWVIFSNVRDELRQKRAARRGRSR